MLLLDYQPEDVEKSCAVVSMVMIKKINTIKK